MRRLRFQKSAEQGIDISPLIDVVFILLIFFMVSTTFVKDMKVDLSRPGASSASAANSKSLRIYIDRYQSIYLNNQKIQPWVLQGKIRDFLSQNPTKSLLVVTDAKVPVDKVVEVIDQARMAGISDVGVATEAEGGAQ